MSTLCAEYQQAETRRAELVQRVLA